MISTGGSYIQVVCIRFVELCSDEAPRLLFFTSDLGAWRAFETAHPLKKKEFKEETKTTETI